MCSDDKTTQRLYNKCYTGQERSCVAIDFDQNMLP